MAFTDRRGFMHGTGTAVAAAAVVGAGGRLVAAEAFEATTARYRVRVKPLVLGLDRPWGIDFLPDGDGILVTERAGRLRLIRGGRLDPVPIAGLPKLVVASQGGLLDVALHPDFARNRLVYLTYAGGVHGATFTGLARGRLGTGSLERLELLFQSWPFVNSLKHYGSRIVFRDGHVFVSVGDRGEMERAQRLSDYGGKIVRLLHDGRIPSDNPFVGRSGALPGIWALGIRNPQGLALSPSGLLWECEHGPMGGDEVNIIYRGQNYGWPLVTYGKDYDGTPIGEGTRKAGTIQPRRYWDPSIAPSGLSFYAGDLFPAWRGNLFMGALKDRMLVRMELDAQGRSITHEERLLVGAIGRVRQVRPGPDGRLYLLTDQADGGVWTVEPAAP